MNAPSLKRLISPDNAGSSFARSPILKDLSKNGGLACLLFAFWIGVGFGGCTAAQPASFHPEVLTTFFSPQSIAAHTRWILVANSAFYFDGVERKYAQGFITVLDRATRKPVSRIASTQLNPQQIAIVGDTAYVVNAGTVAIDEKGLAVATSAGGIDIIQLAANTPPSSIEANIPLPVSETDPRIGLYGSLAISADRTRAFIGSGTRSDLFEVDLTNRTLVHGPENPIRLFADNPTENGLSFVTWLRDQLVVVNFNADALCLIPEHGRALTKKRCGTIGVNDQLIEGPIDASEGPDGKLYVLMTIANAVYEVDVTKAPFVVTPLVATTGLASNRLLRDDPFFYVVNSASNNVQRINPATQESWSTFAPLPVASNPYDIAITNEDSGTKLGWVTLFSLHQVAIVNLTTGMVIEVLSNPVPSSASDASHSDGGFDSSDLEATTDPPMDQSPDQPVSCNPPIDPVGIHSLVSATYGDGAGFGQSALPSILQGGPHGGGLKSGSTHVLSLGVGGELIVDFGDYDIVDGEGADFIVFENSFEVSPGNLVTEPGIVGVSETSSDASAFIDFPCDVNIKGVQPDSSHCAGFQPVLANVTQNCIDPTDITLAGGDAFDLATLTLKRARYVRIKDTGTALSGTDNRGFDLDAIVLIHYDKRTK